MTVNHRSISCPPRKLISQSQQSSKMLFKGCWKMAKEHRCQIALRYIQTLQNKTGRIVFTCYFPKNKVITVLAVKFHKDLHPMFRKINHNDNNKYNLLTTYHVPGPMLRTVRILVLLRLWHPIPPLHGK